MKNKANYLTCLIGLSISAPITAQALDKIQLCHVTGSGQTVVLNLPIKAVNSHLINHGDVLPSTLYEDSDSDGLGNPDISLQTCESFIDGFVDNNADTNDLEHRDITQAREDLAALEKDYEEVGTESVDDDAEGDEGDEY